MCIKLVYSGTINFKFCHFVAIDKKVKIRIGLFFVRIIILGLVFDIKQEKSSCCILMSPESIRKSPFRS